jgi:membrane-associated phospholipid phosphatase
VPVTVDTRARGVLACVVVAVAAVLVGWLLSTVDRGRGFARWDQSLAEWGSTHATSRSTTALKAVTQLGSSYVLVPVMSVVALIDWRRRRDVRTIWFLVVVGVGQTLLNNLLKLLVDRDRPTVVHLVDAAGSSFPSGHSAAAASCWLAVALVARRWSERSGWMAPAAVVVACAVALSRAMLGVHWLTDVLAGLIVGWSWCLLWAILLGLVGDDGHMSRR